LLQFAPPAQHFSRPQLGAFSEREKPGPGQTFNRRLRTPRLSHLRGQAGTTCCGVFANTPCSSFEKHGIKNIAYWTPTDEPLKGKTLIYIIRASQPRKRRRQLESVRPTIRNGKAVRDKSEANGKIVEKVDSTYLVLTDFSPPLH